MSPHTKATAPAAARALEHLREQIQDEASEVEPVVVDTAHVLEALCQAARKIGAEDAHVSHWLDSPNLAVPRRSLPKKAAAYLVAYDRASEKYRGMIREIIHARMKGTSW